MRIDAALLALALVLMGVGAARWRSGMPQTAWAALNPGSAPSLRAGLGVDSMETLEAAIVDGDIFRIAREPAAVRFQAVGRQGVNAGARPSANGPGVRPAFVLRGIMGGPPWQALVDGIPGQAGATIVTAGATFDRLRVRSVLRDTVVIEGPDTTWTLTMRRGTQ
jgi:hypothetical protein